MSPTLEAISVGSTLGQGFRRFDDQAPVARAGKRGAFAVWPRYYLQ
jgi:hypothetical protein